MAVQPIPDLTYIFTHRQGAILNRGFNFAGGPPGPWIAPGDSILTAQFAVEGGDSALVVNPPGSAGTVISGGLVAFWTGGGAAGQTYLVHCTITTAFGCTDIRSMQLNCIKG